MAMARKYTLKQRARQQEETRERILDAVVSLHQELGPAQTSISAIAERAGVQRLTVYRHFPDEPAMFDACRDHWMGLHPPPDVEPMRELGDPRMRLRLILLEMYAYYERTEQMTANIIRDAATSETVASAMQPFVQTVARIQAICAEGWDGPPERRALLLATIGHALDFTTWQSLARHQNLEAEQIADLMVCLANCAAGGEC